MDLSLRIGKVKIKFDLVEGAMTAKDIAKFKKKNARDFEKYLVFSGFCGETPSEPAKPKDTIEIPPYIRFKFIPRINTDPFNPEPAPFYTDADIRKVEQECGKKFIAATELSKDKIKAVVRKSFPPAQIPFPKAEVAKLLGKVEFQLFLHVKFLDVHSNMNIKGMKCWPALGVPYAYFFTIKIIKPCQTEGTLELEKTKLPLMFLPLNRCAKFLELSGLRFNFEREQFTKELQNKARKNKRRNNAHSGSR